MKNEITLQRIAGDINGNPRYVVHFLNCLNDKEKELPVIQSYKVAIKKARSIGGKKYDTKSFGGGIVFQSYNTSDLIKSIIQLSKS